MKKYFLTGLVILLPLAVTLAVVLFVFNLLTEPFAGGVAALMDRYDILERDFFFFSASQVQLFASQLLILLVLILCTTALGAFARIVFFHYLLRLWDRLVHKIPLVRTIYKTCQDVIQTIFTSNNNAFKQVVMVPFPNASTRSIGLVTQQKVEGFGENEVAVFVPTTPNPTSGFMMLFKPDDLIYLDMKVEEAFKYVISCGVLLTPFSVTKKP